MSAQNYNLSYQIEPEVEDPEIKQSYWDAAVGLNLVDNLTPSKYLKPLIAQSVAGKLNYDQVEEKLQTYYQTQATATPSSDNEKECDLVSTRITALLAENSFVFSPVTLQDIHRVLFTGIYDFAGQYRDYNITKSEEILGGASVNYASHQQISATLSYDFAEEKKVKYGELIWEEQINQVAKFTSAIWQVHPFGEGNTRTTAVFIEKYLRSLGFEVNNQLFKDHSIYFRSALVRDNYTDVKKNISPTTKFLILFLENLLTKQKNILDLQQLVIKGRRKYAKINLVYF
jgi:fido (protein-threonine AMPylation protein)